MASDAHDGSLREHLARLLDWEDAHAGFDAAVDRIPSQLRGAVPAQLPYSPWQLLEHLRRCQRDILDFCRDPAYEEPPFESLWPKDPAPPSDDAWDGCVSSYRRDRDELRRLAADRNVDLFGKIPRGSGQTYLRELLLVADHNAYHVGQLIVVRRLLGMWT